MEGETTKVEQCPFHRQPLMTIYDMEFHQFFGIKEARVFCCPLRRCDYISFGTLIKDNDLILSAERHLQLLMFARQKGMLEKLTNYTEVSRKIKNENLSYDINLPRPKLTWHGW